MQPPKPWPRPDREPMGIVPRPIPQTFRSYHLEGQGKQMLITGFGSLGTRTVLVNQGKQMGYQPLSRVRIWNEYDSFAARIAAPIWLFVWVMTWSRVGKGLWRWEERKKTDWAIGRGPPPP